MKEAAALCRTRAAKKRKKQKSQRNSSSKMSAHVFFFLQATKHYAAKLQLTKASGRALSNGASDASWWCACSQLHTAPSGLNAEIKRG